MFSVRSGMQVLAERPTENAARDFLTSVATVDLNRGRASRYALFENAKLISRFELRLDGQLIERREGGR